MPKKGGKKGKGKAKVLDWGEIVREQYVTIEVRHDHAVLRCLYCCVILRKQLHPCMAPLADAKRKVALDVLQAHDGRLRAGASLAACSQPALPPPHARLRRMQATPASSHPSQRAAGPQPRAIPASHEPARPPPHPTSHRTPARQLGRRRMPAQPPPHARLAAARMSAEQRDPRGCRWTRCAACSWSSTGWAAARA